MSKHYNVKIKREYKQDLVDTYPNAFEKVPIEKKTKNISYNNNFIKYFQMENKIRKQIIDKIGITYF
jgi:hypothetical protein